MTSILSIKQYINFLGSGTKDARGYMYNIIHKQVKLT